jgi:hypothetical protein
VDSTQTAIVERLRDCGVQVEVIGQPVDLLISYRLPSGEVRTECVECKNPDGRDRITKAQAEFLARWIGVVHIVRSPDEAVYAVLGPKHCDMPLDRVRNALQPTESA